VAAGIDTPKLTFSSASPVDAAQSSAVVMAATADIRMTGFMAISRAARIALRERVTIVASLCDK
jgi:hypothetical protein